jgi:cation diffusion facilitator family transporter
MGNAKRTVAIVSIFASALMAVLKLVAGLLTGSLGLLSEAAHSGLDLGATVLTYLAVWVSDRPPDDEHLYGHGKVESVAALAETTLLLLTSVGIVFEAARRLLTNQFEVESSAWAIAVIVLAIAIDAWRAYTLKRVARETNSQALEADALHFSSDILSSIVVLVGLWLVAAGYPKADALAAIGVAAFVSVAGYRLGRRTVNTLIDTAPRGAAARVGQVVAEVPGVAEVERVRVRPAGSVLFVDLEVAISRVLPLDSVSEIKRRVTERVRQIMAEADVTVTTRALALDDETVLDRVRVIAANLGLAIHHVTVQKLADRLSVSLDLEVDGRQSLGAAHETATRLEAAIGAELGPTVEVETHIEPLLVDDIAGKDVDAKALSEIAASISASAAAMGTIRDVHDVRARRTGQGLFITFHCGLDPRWTVEQVHDAINELEQLIRQRWPNARRIVAHAEPTPCPAAESALALTPGRRQGGP